MTDLALSMFRASSKTQDRRQAPKKTRIGGVWQYRLLVWAFRNS
jgi:hypothetical protein